MRALSGVTVALLTALLLAGCTAAPSDGSASPSASATRTPVATPTPTVDAPVSAFGGDCANMLSDEIVSTTFGQPARATTTAGQTSPPQALLGGLTCSWRSDDGLLTVVTLPSESVPPTLRDDFAETTCGGHHGGACRGSVSSGGLWMQVRYLPAVIADRSAEIDALRQELAESADAHPGATRTAAEDGWWALPACEELGAAVDVAAILGVDAVIPEYPADDVLPDEIHPALVASGVEGWCAWTAVDAEGNAGENLQLYVWPGAAAKTQALLGGEGSAPVTIPGADSASLAEGGLAIPRIVYATAGPNAVQVYGWTDSDDVLAFTEAVLAHLAAPS